MLMTISEIVVNVCVTYMLLYNAGLIFGGPSPVFIGHKVTFLPWQVLAGSVIKHLM